MDIVLVLVDQSIIGIVDDADRGGGFVGLLITDLSLTVEVVVASVRVAVILAESVSEQRLVPRQGCIVRARCIMIIVVGCAAWKGGAPCSRGAGFCS